MGTWNVPVFSPSNGNHEAFVAQIPAELPVNSEQTLPCIGTFQIMMAYLVSCWVKLYGAAQGDDVVTFPVEGNANFTFVTFPRGWQISRLHVHITHVPPEGDIVWGTEPTIYPGVIAFSSSQAITAPIFQVDSNHFQLSVTAGLGSYELEELQWINWMQSVYQPKTTDQDGFYIRLLPGFRAIVRAYANASGPGVGYTFGLQNYLFNPANLDQPGTNVGP